MPLIKCVDCGKMVSTRAQCCMNCGCPVSVTLAESATETADAAIAVVASEVVESKNGTTMALAEQGDEHQEEAAIVEDSVHAERSQEVSTLSRSAVSPVMIGNVTYYGVRKTLDPDTFYRDALLAMTIDRDTPPDLFSGTFDPAVESMKYVGSFTANVTGSYSAQIGYEMVRTKTEYRNGRAVEKREHYIEWRPFSGNYAGEHTVAEPLVDDPMDENIAFAYTRAVEDLGLRDEQIGTEDYIEPTQTVINAAMQACKEEASIACEDTLPGSKHKEYSFSGYAQLTKVECHTIPTYSIPFTYQGESYRKSFFAMKEHVGASFGKIPDIGDEIQDRVDKKLRPLGIVAIVLLSLSMVAGLVFAFLRTQVYRSLSLSVSLSVFLLSVFSTVGYWVSRKLYRKSIIRANLVAKVEGVQRLLIEKGLDPLLDAEKDIILGRKSK